MTRFARAKGSKSSNEKKPEEATSWLEMRNSMLLKESTKGEEKSTPVEEPAKIETSKKAEWASLGDTLSQSVSLIKQHMGKKNNSVKEIKNENKKKKRNNESKLDAEVSDVKVKKEKKKKQSLTSKNLDLESKVKKKEKKRKEQMESTVGSENVSPKKKKKLLQDNDLGFSVQEDIEQKAENKEKNNKKIKNEKRGMKSNFLKKRNDEQKGFKSPKGKQFENRKKFKNKHFQEKNSAVEELIINGEKVPITKFQGFYVTLEDAERLKKLRSEMMKEGIPKGKLEAAIKLERRRAEKSLSRLKKSVCFHCRGHGHLLSNCPNLLEKENTGTGICYKCGSTEHSATECKVVRGTNYQFAECFICKEQGHIARQCPDNPRGLYPQGGACRECGDVTHLRKDCPKVQAQKADEVVTVGVRRDRDLECLDEEIDSREKHNAKKKVKKSLTVKF